MRNVYLFQVFHNKDTVVSLPYTVAMLWLTAIRDHPHLENEYTLKNMFCTRTPFEERLDELDNPSVVAFSCYVWNWEYNKHMAKLIKERWPDCTIVFGGPQVDQKDPNIFKECTALDFAFYDEAEYSFGEWLVEHAKAEPNYWRVNGIAFPTAEREREVTLPEMRRYPLEQLPSPYRAGMMEEIMEPGVKYESFVENTRGCPYKCTFCVWGNDIGKLRKRELHDVYWDIEWSANNDIIQLQTGDANFGIFYERDYSIASFVSYVKRKTNFPKEYTVSWAKNSSKKLIAIAELLRPVGLHRAMTLSFQSLDEETQQKIKRDNLDKGTYKALSDYCIKNNIATYTQFILGLPGETYDTFVDGIAQVMEWGQHQNIEAFLCHVFVNSELHDDVEKYGIKYKSMPSNIDVSNFYGVPEYTDIVYATDSMPYPDWKRSFMFKAMTLGWHVFGWTHITSRVMRNAYGIGYREFYEELIDWARNNPNTVPGYVYNVLESNDIFSLEQDWPEECRDLKNTASVHDSCVSVMTAKRHHNFLKDLKKFIYFLAKKRGIELNPTFVNELLDFQKNYTIIEGVEYPVKERYTWNLYDVAFHLGLNGETIELQQTQPHNIEFDTLDEWPYLEIGKVKKFKSIYVDYGRKMGAARAKVSKTEA